MITKKKNNLARGRTSGSLVTSIALLLLVATPGYFINICYDQQQQEAAGQENSTG